MTRSASLLACLFLLLPLVVGCRDASPEPARSVLLAVTGNAAGEIAHCDCPEDAVGGLARRAAYLRHLRDQSLNRLLVVEAGNFLYAPAATDATAETARAALIGQVYNRLDYDVAFFSARDYAFGLDPMTAAMQHMGRPVVSANVVNEAKLLWRDSWTVQRGGLKIVFLGVNAPIPAPDQAVTRWQVTAPAAALAEPLPRLRRQADLVILLTDLQPAALNDLLDQVRGVDFVLRSDNDPLPAQRVQELQGVPTISLPARGRHVGLLDVTVAKKGERFADASERALLERKIARYQEHLAAVDRQAGGAEKAESFLADRDEELAQYQRYRQAVADWRASLDKPRRDANRYSFQLVELGPQFGDDAGIAQLVNAFLTAHNLQPPRPGAAAGE
jgi:2',3'-cyclic-nucleotide 2'-phosphodiesterase (5'-nucleotidase family)